MKFDEIKWYADEDITLSDDDDEMSVTEPTPDPEPEPAPEPAPAPEVTESTVADDIVLDDTSEPDPVPDPVPVPEPTPESTPEPASDPVDERQAAADAMDYVSTGRSAAPGVAETRRDATPTQEEEITVPEQTTESSMDVADSKGDSPECDVCFRGDRS